MTLEKSTDEEELRRLAAARRARMEAELPPTIGVKDGGLLLDILMVTAQLWDILWEYPRRHKRNLKRLNDLLGPPRSN